VPAGGRPFSRIIAEPPDIPEKIPFPVGGVLVSFEDWCKFNEIKIIKGRPRKSLAKESALQVFCSAKTEPIVL
jgi:hypothetical protein